ncbi:hypothetical protein J5TS2_23780 [Brevibacillus halotolerans]|nr:hypothetical protein J5TS2_23780 [Brevibacillus halotolerans]
MPALIRIVFMAKDMHTDQDLKGFKNPQDNFSPKGFYLLSMIAKPSFFLAERLVLSSMMVVALLGSQSVYASEMPQTFHSNHKVNVTPQVDVAASYNYAVTIKTANVEDAGTDSNIYVTLNGSKRSSPTILFDKPGYDDFERGAIDTYYISASKDLGEIKSITICSDSTGKKPGWFSTTFTVEYNDSTWIFHNDEWIGEHGAQTVTLSR